MADAHIVLAGRRPEAKQGPNVDNGHVLFHADCCPCAVQPELVRQAVVA